jgi:hypothetical protein
MREGLDKEGRLESLAAWDFVHFSTIDRILCWATIGLHIEGMYLLLICSCIQILKTSYYSWALWGNFCEDLQSSAVEDDCLPANTVDDGYIRGIREMK